ncbi:hypothetical protein EMPS_02310 [Entomortierella parvispora]|uniref:Cardiolipin synthase N-terminal domain-containing protein n=1 Tax=Entomortierella parvispora TaxID=205924 RepID=A0A9P3H4J8_9FUNG|nr:hypothetical protein EMPS_02310 [Entomortierella parvispora]
MHPAATYGGSFFGLVIFILDLIAIFEVINSNRTTVSKLGWSLLIFLFPILGLVLYFLFGNREEHNAGSGYEAIV